MFCLFIVFSTVISDSTLARDNEHGALGKTMLDILVMVKIQLTECGCLWTHSWLKYIHLDIVHLKSGWVADAPRFCNVE